MAQDKDRNITEGTQGYTESGRQGSTGSATATRGSTRSGARGTTEAASRGTGESETGWSGTSGQGVESASTRFGTEGSGGRGYGRYYSTASRRTSQRREQSSQTGWGSTSGLSGWGTTTSPIGSREGGIGGGGYGRQEPGGFRGDREYQERERQWSGRHEFRGEFGDRGGAYGFEEGGYRGGRSQATRGPEDFSRRGEYGGVESPRNRRQLGGEWRGRYGEGVGRPGELYGSSGEAYGGAWSGRGGRYGRGQVGGEYGQGQFGERYGQYGGTYGGAYGSQYGGGYAGDVGVREPSIGLDYEREGRYGRERGRTRWQREALTAREIMTTEVKAVTKQSTIQNVAEIMKDENCGIVPVVDENHKLQGVVTDRDIVIRALAEAKSPSELKIEDIMTDDVEAVTPDEEIRDIIDLMGSKQIRRVPVVERDDRLIGIISMGDIANRADYDEDLQEALEQISAKRSFWSRLWS